MIEVLFDTNVCIQLIRRKSDSGIARLRRWKIWSVGVSAITIAELEFGVAKSRDPLRNRLRLGEFCAPLTVCHFDDRAAAMYGEIRASLERDGTPIGPLDLLISAHALALDVPLATNNVREFSRVPGLSIMKWPPA